MKASGNKMEDKIRKATIALAREMGFSNVKIKDICAHTGCSEGTFYYHFGSMKGLFESFRTWSSVITSDVLVEVVALPGAWSKLWRIHKAYVALALSFGYDMFWAMISQVPEEERVNTINSTNSMAALIEPIIREGQASGEIGNPTRAELLCQTVGLTMFGVIYYWFINSGKIDLEQKMRLELATLYTLRDDLR